MMGAITLTPTVFDMPHTVALNKAELEHLATLGLPLGDKTVLEVGAGVGKLTHFFIERRCDVVSTDGRPENVEEMKRRCLGQMKIEIVNLMDPHSHSFLGTFDIVFCYGVLYHTSDPAMVLRDLAEACDEVLLLSTCVWPEDIDGVVDRWEHKGRDQSLSHAGCRPGRPWVMARLRGHFPHVYHTVTQPDHPQYRLEWPAGLIRKKELVRSIFVASRIPLDHLPALSPVLLLEQRRAL